MYKKIIGLFILFLLFSSVSFSSSTVPLDFTTWSKYHANGSEVLNVTPTEAVFKILRTNPGPKKDVRTHGYAYLISGPISIPFDWGKIIIEGTWWKDKKSGENYQEMVFFTFAKEPSVIHGSGNTNYMYTIYEDWNKILRCDDVGETPDIKTEKRIPRKMPETPTRFKLIIQGAIPRGEPTWAYWEKRSDGHWKKVYEQEYSNMFNDTSHDKFYFKIGGWTSWEYPVSSILHFKDFKMTVYAQEEIQEGLGNVVFDEETLTPTPSGSSSCNIRPEGIENTILSMLPPPDGHIIPFPKVLHPGGSSYRGACGSGKPKTAINYPDVGIVIPYPSQDSNCYYFVYFQDVIEVGTHLACRFHDACFDICKEEKGETSNMENYVGPCHDICSGVVIEVFGAKNGARWMQGKGPYDDMILFWGKRKILGPYDKTITPVKKLIEDGIISKDTGIYYFPFHPTKSLYMIEVWTGNKFLAGTDAHIYIELVDDKARSSGWIEMPSAPITRDNFYDAITSNELSMFSGEKFKNSGFERGNHEKYYFIWAGYVDKVDHIFLKRDDYGVGSDWYCDRIKVYREKWDSFETPEELGEIPVHSWIGTKAKKFNAK